MFQSVATDNTQPRHQNRFGGVLARLGIGAAPQVRSLTAIQVRKDGVALVRVVRPNHEPPRVTACDFRPAQHAGELKSAMLQLAGDFDLARERCTMSLETGEYTLLLTEAPIVPREDMRSAVRWRIKDLIDFPVDDALVDVFDVPKGGATGAAHSIYVVAARNNAIRRVADLCSDAGINLDVIDISELAQRNLATLCAEDAAGLALLLLEADHGLITITRGGELYFSRRIEVGIETLRGAESSAVYFEQVALEVQRSLDYFDSHFREAPVGHLMVAPLPPASGLIEFLNSNLNIQVVEVRIANRVACDPAQAALLEEHCLTALGAALRDEGPGA